MPCITKVPGKRVTFDGLSRPAEGYGQKAQPETVIVSSVFHDTFSLCAAVKGVEVNFLIDTGAAVPLIHSSLWRRIPEIPLELWIVGKDVSPLQVLGCAKVVLSVGNTSLPSCVRRHGESYDGGYP